jgi:hypothetical protein
MIKVNFIIHIAGKPEPLVLDALKKTQEKLEDKNNKFKVKNCEVAEIELNEETTLFGGFLEVLIQFEKMEEVLNFVIDYNPTSIEVESPTKITTDNYELTEFLNILASSLLDGQQEIRSLRAYVHELHEKLGIKK